MRETFAWTGENPQVLEQDQLVGRLYQADDGRTGKIVANTGLSVTVEFSNDSEFTKKVREIYEEPVTLLEYLLWPLARAYLNFRDLIFGR